MRPLTENEYLYLRAADVDEYYSWLEEHTEVDRLDYMNHRYPEINESIGRLLASDMLIRPTMGESVDAYIQRVFPERMEHEQRELTREEVRLIVPMSGTQFANWIQSHPNVSAGAYYNSPYRAEEVHRWRALGDTTQDEQEQRELTQSEFEYLYHASVSQFLEWFGLHPEVDNDSYSHWYRRLEDGSYTLGLEYTPRTPVNLSAQVVQQTTGITVEDVTRAYNQLNGVNMPELNSPVRFRNGHLQEDTTRQPTETFSQWFNRTHPVEISREETMPERTRARTRRTAPITTYTITCTNHSDVDHNVGIERVLKQYAQTLKKNIWYSCPHHEEQSPNPHLPPDTIEILFWCTSEHMRSDTSDGSRVYFGIETDSNGHGDTFYFPSGYESQPGVYQDPQGHNVLQVIGNTLYVFFDLPHSEHNQAELMTALMELYASTLDPKEVAMRKKVSETAAQKRVGEVLALTLANIPNTEIAREKNNLQSYEQKVETYQIEMMSYMRKLVQSRLRLQQLEATKGNLETRVNRELKSIKKIKGVKKLTTRMNTLRVMTETIYIETPVAKYEIGEFALEYGQDGTLKIINQTRRVDYASRTERPLDHPHVRQGDPCWGNMSEIMQYVLSGEIAMATAMIMEYLKNYTQGDAWAPLDQWPKVLDTPTGTVLAGNTGQTELNLVGAGASPEAQHDSSLEPFIRMGLYTPTLVARVIDNGEPFIGEDIALGDEQLDDEDDAENFDEPILELP